jgi:RNA polymerase sigma-70 factor (ECF subfamily)
MTPLLAYRLRRDFDGSFETVYRRHVRDVYGFALGILGNPDDAEDVTQTTFMNAYRALQRGDRVQNLRAWLLAIAHNVCRQRFRTAARRPQEVELDPEAAEAFNDDDAPSAQDIRDAMTKLSFNQRTVLVLREIEGLSYEEIAQTMDVSLSAVETLLFRARKALREQLEVAERDLGCDAIQRLISLQLDGRLSRADRGLLRAHLRGCGECARFARSQRARKRVMPSLVGIPLPASLSGVFGGGASVVTAKAAAIAVSAALVGAGALVETGVVDLPGTEERQAVTTPVFGAGVDDVFSPSTGSQVPAEFSISAIDSAIESAIGAGAASGGARVEAGDGTNEQRGGQGGAGAAAVAAPGGAEGGSGGGSATGGTVGETASGVGSGLLGGGGGGGSGLLGGGSGGGGVVPPPPAGPVGDAVEAVGGAVDGVTGAVGGATGGATGGAGSKLPPPPVSLPVEPPSLPPVPPVPNPVPGGGPSLP